MNLLNLLPKWMLFWRLQSQCEYLIGLWRVISEETNLLLLLLNTVWRPRADSVGRKQRKHYLLNTKLPHLVDDISGIWALILLNSAETRKGYYFELCKLLSLLPRP